jgi:hypothetical protein
MKWFDNWILKKADKISKKNSSEKMDGLVSHKILRNTISESVGDSLDSPAVRFKMFKASGGTIIETNIYDNNRDRHINGLYVITNDKNLGDEIGKILTMETLKI